MLRSKVLLISAFLVSISAVAFAQEVKPLNIPGVTEYHNLRYLPEFRYTGAEGERGDYEMYLDLFVPEGQGPFPMVMYVHGGGYGGGSKQISKTNLTFVKRLLEEGFAVSSLNYILTPKGIFPQAWWDFQDSIRFLRMNADKYKLDPLRFGAYGLSAGGWLISSSTVANGDYIRRTNGSALTTEELKKRNWRFPSNDIGSEDTWLRPMKDPHPAWNGFHGGVTAISQDFDHYLQHLQPYNPYVQKWAGMDYVPTYWKDIQENRAEGIFEFARMADESFKGKKVHVPPMYPKSDKESGKAMAIAHDGKIVPLGEVMLEFFKRKLVEDCRLPTPEIYPTIRVLAPGEKVKVSIVAPQGTELFYTVNSSEPTTPYRHPFEVSAGDIVRTICKKAGFISSGVNSAHFVEGPPPPIITGPEDLPPAKTGEPYKVQFTADQENVRWMALGELRPHVPWRESNVYYPNNLALDSETGVWSGTPWKPGRYWLQLWVNSGDGSISTHKDYILEVNGEELKGQSWEAKATETDQNIELATLIYDKGWHRGHIQQITGLFKSRAIKCIIVGEKEENRMLLIEKDSVQQAKNLLIEYAKSSIGLVEKIQWTN